MPEIMNTRVHKRWTCILTCINVGCSQSRGFWPSCFFYLCTLVPITWYAELTLLEGRLNRRTEDVKILVPGGLFVGQEDLKKLCEIGLMIIVILGRWMLPRGSITRDQLSVLLLEYVAIAADILELFEAFEDEQVSRNKEITMLTLGVFSWSLLQFTLVTTSFGKGKQDEDENETTANEAHGVEAGLSRKYLRKAVEARKKQTRRQEFYRLQHEGAEEEMRKLELQGDRYGILAAMFMQDGPFLILRLYLIITYDFFVDPKFLFYIGKNIISLLLMIYRLYVIHFPAEEKEMVIEKPKLFRSLSFVLIGAQRFKSAAAKKLGNKERRFSQKGRR